MPRTHTPTPAAALDTSAHATRQPPTTIRPQSALSTQTACTHSSGHESHATHHKPHATAFLAAQALANATSITLDHATSSCDCKYPYHTSRSPLHRDETSKRQHALKPASLYTHKPTDSLYTTLTPQPTQSYQEPTRPLWQLQLTSSSVLETNPKDDPPSIRCLRCACMCTLSHTWAPSYTHPEPRHSLPRPHKPCQVPLHHSGPCQSAPRL